MEEASRAVTGESDDMTRMASDRIDATLSRIRDAVDAGRKGLDEQAEALGMMIDQSRTALSTIGDDTARALAENAGQIEAKLREIDAMLERQSNLAGQLTGGLDSG